MDLPALLSDLLPPLLVQLTKFGFELYRDHRQSRSSRRRPSSKAPRKRRDDRIG